MEPTELGACAAPQHPTRVLFSGEKYNAEGYFHEEDQAAMALLGQEEPLEFEGVMAKRHDEMDAARETRELWARHDAMQRSDPARFGVAKYDDERVWVLGPADDSLLENLNLRDVQDATGISSDQVGQIMTVQWRRDILSQRAMKELHEVATNVGLGSERTPTPIIDFKSLHGTFACLYAEHVGPMLQKRGLDVHAPPTEWWDDPPDKLRQFVKKVFKDVWLQMTQEGQTYPDQFDRGDYAWKVDAGAFCGSQGLVQEADGGSIHFVGMNTGVWDYNSLVVHPSFMRSMMTPPHSGQRLVLGGFVNLPGGRKQNKRLLTKGRWAVGVDLSKRKDTAMLLRFCGGNPNSLPG